MASGARAREIILLALCWALLAAVALRPSIRGNDGVGNYIYLASILRGGDLDFTGGYAAFDDLKQYPFKFSELPASPITGLPGCRYGVGAAIFWSPFVAAAHVVTGALRPKLANAISRPFEWAVGVATAFWGGVALLMLYVRLRRQTGVCVAAATLAALVFATPLGFYLLAHGSMSHGVEFFVSVAALLAFERYWREPKFMNAFLVGMAAGLLVLVRAQAATWTILLGLAVVWRPCLTPEPPKPGRIPLTLSPRSILVGFIFAFGALLVFSPQLYVWRVLNGAWLSGPAPYLDGSAGEFYPGPRYACAALFSERGGALAWHPVMALGLVWLAIAIRRSPAARPAAWMGLYGFLAMLWLVGSWSMWWGGASFGNRFFISALPWLAVGIAGWLGAGGVRLRPLRATVLCLLIIWNMGLLAQYAREMIPREDAVPWTQVIRQNVTGVPRLILDRL